MTKKELIENGDYTEEEIENFMDTYGEENLDDIDEIIDLENNGNDPEMIKAGIYLGIDLNNIEEAYQGKWSSDEEFVEELLTSIGDIPNDLPPYIHIDWEWTAREIMMDYSEENGHYFRNI